MAVIGSPGDAFLTNYFFNIRMMGYVTLSVEDLARSLNL